MDRRHIPITTEGTPVKKVNSLLFTSLRTSNSPCTLRQSWRKIDGWESLVWFPASWNLFTCTMESTLTGCITAWCRNSTSLNHRALQGVVQTSQHLKVSFPTIRASARRIIRDSSHPNYGLFSLLLSGRLYRSTSFCTSRLQDSFFSLDCWTVANNTITITITTHCMYQAFYHDHLSDQLL